MVAALVAIVAAFALLDFFQENVGTWAAVAWWLVAMGFAVLAVSSDIGLRGK
jgi:hypothetical protein